MALQELLLKRDLDLLYVRQTALGDVSEQFQQREATLSAALDEAETDDDMTAVREEIETYTAELKTHNERVADVNNQIAQKEAELSALRASAPPVNHPTATDFRKEVSAMNLRAFAYMTPERRDRFLSSPDVNDFVERFRDKFRGASGTHARAVSGADLLIPEVVLDVLRESVQNYSRLLSYVRVVSLNGDARMPILGAIPEAVWTEVCASLNELHLTFGQVEVNQYKVGAYAAICNATLEDTNPVLANEIVYSLGVAVGKALDKAIMFGTGIKMPLGFVSRLAQTSAPADYPAKARPWENLSQSNIITIPSGKTGLDLFKALVTASGSAKSNYSDGRRFWIMSDATRTRLISEAMSINATGAIATGFNNVMPVIGGDIIVLPDDVVSDGSIYGGYGSLYLLGERKGMTVGYSDHVFFLQEQTAFKASARYDGVPVIPEGFVAIGLDGNAPATSAQFNPDVVNAPDASLRALAVGDLTLTPAFASATTSYTASTTSDSAIINFIPAQGATATVSVGGKRVQPGRPAKFADGENAVVVTVTSGDASQAYTVTVTKS